MILLTGATGGLGAPIAEYLVNSNYSIIGTGRNKEQLSGIKALLGKNFLSYNLDLRDFNGYTEFIKSLPILNGIVFCAGVVNTIPIRYITPSVVQETMDINVSSPLIMLSEVLKQRKLSRNSSVIFVSSITGPVKGYNAMSIYGASKAALIGAVKSLAVELSGKKIRVNAVSPSGIDTGCRVSTFFSRKWIIWLSSR